MTPDARLSAAERAALADLESAVTAADPTFAARLRGNRWSRLRALPPIRLSHATHAVDWALGLGLWAAVPTLVVGLALAVLGVSAGLGLAVVGVLVATAGLGMLARWTEKQLADRAGRRPAPGPDSFD